MHKSVNQTLAWCAPYYILSRAQAFILGYFTFRHYICVAKSLFYFQQSAATSYAMSSRSVATAILHKKHYYIAKWPNANILEWFTHQLKCYKSTQLNYYFSGCYGFISYGLGMTAQKLHITINICLWDYSLREKIIKSLDKDFTRLS